jgi:hypothetical protein
VTRPHHDVDIALFREDQGQLRSYLRAWKWQKLSHGQFLSWQPNEFVVPPIHELSATCQGERLEFLLNECHSDLWLYRRNLNIGRDLNHFRFAYDGIPYLPPEIVLLYKTKTPKDKDIADCHRGLLRGRIGSGYSESGRALHHAENLVGYSRAAKQVIGH